MPWPTPQDYNEAVQNPQLNIDDPELRAGTPELTPLGLPRAITGGFASVYRLQSGGRDWAVRCFLREVPDQQERYAAIGRHLAAAKLPYTVGFAFLPEGIRVGGRPYPLLKMEWVQGEALDRWIERHLGDPAALRGLADRWVVMLRALRKAGVAHGDLQHGNILVVNDELRLIDYDGMYVPALAGRPGTEVGHRNYQHPRRAESDFGPGCDAFAAWTIFLSLRALGVEPGLWQRLGAGDEHLLLRREDYERPANSASLQALDGLADPDFHALITRFRALLALDVANLPPLDGTDTPANPARRAATTRRRGVRTSTAVVSRPPAPVTGAAAWLTDHLTPAAPVAVAASYMPERVLGGLCAGTLLGLAIAAVAGLLALSLVAPVGGGVAALFLLTLGLRYLASPLLPRRLAAQGRVWRVELRLAWLGLGLGQIDRWLARIDGREARELDGLNARRQEVAREAREAIGALDQGLKRFTVERQLLKQAEEEALAQALRDLRHRSAADHLAGYPVLTAAIPGLGPQLKLRLLTAGVRTAAQIRDVRVSHAPSGNAGGEVVQIEVPGRGFVQINGLGRKKAHALLAWRQLLETQSAAALPEALPAAEEAAIRLRYHTRQQALERRESAATRAAERRKETLRQQLRDRRAALDRDAAIVRDHAAEGRQQAEPRLADRQAQIATAHLALALARRDLAAYDEVRFALYVKRVLFFSR